MGNTQYSPSGDQTNAEKFADGVDVVSISCTGDFIPATEPEGQGPRVDAQCAALHTHRKTKMGYLYDDG